MQIFFAPTQAAHRCNKFLCLSHCTARDGKYLRIEQVCRLQSHIHMQKVSATFHQVQIFGRSNANLFRAYNNHIFQYYYQLFCSVRYLRKGCRCNDSEPSSMRPAWIKRLNIMSSVVHAVTAMHRTQASWREHSSFGWIFECWCASPPFADHRPSAPSSPSHTAALQKSK